MPLCISVIIHLWLSHSVSWCSLPPLNPNPRLKVSISFPLLPNWVFSVLSHDHDIGTLSWSVKWTSCHASHKWLQKCVGLTGMWPNTCFDCCRQNIPSAQVKQFNLHFLLIIWGFYLLRLRLSENWHFLICSFEVWPQSVSCTLFFHLVGAFTALTYFENPVFRFCTW